MSINVYCPNCGHKLEQGEYAYNCDTANIHVEHCPECGEEGSVVLNDEQAVKKFCEENIMAKKKKPIEKEEFKQLILGYHKKYGDKFELTEDGLGAIYNALYDGDDGIEFRDALYDNPNGLDEDTKIRILGLWREFIVDKIMNECKPAKIVKEVYEGEVANYLGWGVDFATNGDNTDNWAEKIAEICGVTL